MITLNIPAFSFGPALLRTWESSKPICDNLVVISTAVFDDDLEKFKEVADSVVELPWNYVFLNGFGEIHNKGMSTAKNDWQLLFGIGETLAETYVDIHPTLKTASNKIVFRCNHHNDPHTWGRIWNRQGGTRWSGLIHEDIVGGISGNVIFRFQDTDKEPRADIYEQETLKYLKVLSYNLMYQNLLRDPSKLGGTNSGWLTFVRGAQESINKLCSDNQDMLDAILAGDKARFLDLVKQRVDSEYVGETGVSFEATGSDFFKENYPKHKHA